MSKEYNIQEEKKALHIGSASGSFDLDDVRASIQNALFEQGIGIFECLPICDNILKHLENNGMLIKNDT